MLTSDSLITYFNAFFIFARLTLAADDEYTIGVGIADITGPITDINIMGYGKADQDASGLHFRLYSRAFVIIDSVGNRVCYVNNDLGMISTAVKQEVVKRVKNKFNGLYHEANLLLSATHTHGGPGGFLPYVLYIALAQGFNWQNFEAIVSGIIRAIERAHTNTRKGKIYYNQGELLDASINRSPTAYIQNPAAERAKYKHNTDKTMSILKFVDSSGKPMGVLSFFAVHCTSMNNTNKLITGDNKGYASMLFEKEMNPGSFPGKGPFVAAFANANEGDVSPNIMGPRCINTGDRCDIHTSTCESKEPRNQGFLQNEKCIAFGPGSDMFESTRIIGNRQYKKAKELFDTATEPVKGPTSFIHQYIDMSNVTIVLPNNKIVHTCKSAMGVSFAAGTTDGAGAFDFRQGATKSTPVWNIVRNFLKRPTPEMEKCHHPKPILVATGIMKRPYDWQPQIVPTQIVQIGNIVIVALPGEFTTMAGRRIRETVEAEFKRLAPSLKPHVLLAGLSNAYSSYITTFEEYQVQRYEGASTAYGPFTEEAYRQQYRMLAEKLITKQKINPGPSPPDLLDRQISLKAGVMFDGAPRGRRFGEVLYDVKPHYYPGNNVFATFISSSPRNDLKTEKTFLAIEWLNPKTKQWVVVSNDANWETKFFWNRTQFLLGESLATVVWEIPKHTEKGIYRIRIFGTSKNIFQKFSDYTGVSSPFKVMAPLHS
ncbi:neutral ceramidase-like protein [Dinothrombium tinctorium]|uniref:Neutral ceramidase n=1 Tax=Dinothrombium tinctorium TaxID=1965070 RepID=A0A3S3SMH0_9ACAR|nr:neutral ceramidase-like protein [Dinothrombium tinctorium]RWS16030.1 neutral ceramidase-like protein [Dinothrombium tinctorium]RWS16056.1 neutral ceramidase-like protein [Dinothrombium tinctorium]RWS17226.1 neutral ceramidase-like protein [Dinothrombium tinctorium]RWS17441.1 neutral ceramidase-like protein [Dinothrombium tinctorium]